MASERSVKNLKMIPPTDIQTAYRDRQSRTAFVLLCGPLGPFCPSPSLSTSLPALPARQEKIHVHGQDTTAENYQILAHIHNIHSIHFLCLPLQRYKDTTRQRDTKIQDTCLLSHTNDF